MMSQTSPAPAQERSERASDRADAAASPAPATGRRILFGAAYYDEYTPASAGPDRLTRIRCFLCLAVHAGPGDTST